MRRIFYTEGVGTSASLGLLAVRIAVGIAFMMHGWDKIKNPTAWMGADGPPAVLQAAAAVAEFVGGGALIVGLLTRLFAVLQAITMAVGAFMVHIPAGHPFVGNPGSPSWELAGVYFAVSLMFVLAGPGRISLDALLFGRRSDGDRFLDAT